MTTEEKRSTNGHVHFEAYEAPRVQPDQRPPQHWVSRYVMPIVLVITALVIFRRLQRGNVV